MDMPINVSFPPRVHVYTDGAIRPERGASGLAAVVRAPADRLPGGQIIAWWSRAAGALTCNEAEYAAAVFAFEQILSLPPAQRPREMLVFSDSRVLVEQMNGRAAAHAPALQRAAARLRTLAAQIGQASFQHIGREHNRLADALAYEAICDGIPVAASPPAGQASRECLHPDTWEQITHLWRKR